MKRFLKIVFAFFAVFCVIPSCACALIDPYNVFHPLSVRDMVVSPNERYIKMVYILNHSDRYNTFIFGSSRVGALHIGDDNGEFCYNMSYSSGTPSENLANIRTMLAEGMTVSKIYVGVDVLSYTVDPASNQNNPMSMPYELSQTAPISFWKLYLDPATIAKAINIAVAAGKRDNTHWEYLYTDGAWIPHEEQLNADWDSAAVTVGSADRMKETLEDVQKISEICAENGIELVLFAMPMYRSNYEAAIERSFPVFLRKLAEIAPYYNFSGYNDISMNTQYWRENSHYTAETGDLLIDVMCYGKRYDDLYEQGFGWYVTEDNVDELLALPEMNGTIMEMR